MRGSGQVSIGSFRYIPADQGIVASNQFEKASGALGEAHLAEPVTDLIRRALLKELVAAGFSVGQNTSPIIEGDIERFFTIGLDSRRLTSISTSIFESCVAVK
jgi:hypothetical protein